MGPETAPNLPDKPFDTPKRPSSVLFLCSHNVIRSPMAAAITKARYGNTVYTASAGVHAGTPDPFVTSVMSELDIDLSAHQPVSLEDLNEGFFDLIVTLSPTAHHIALEMAHVEATEVEYWPAADPTAVQGSRDQMMDAYRDVRDRIASRIDERLAP